VITRRQPNRALLAIVAEGFLSRLSFGLISFALPLYAFRLGMSLASIGFLISLNMIVSVLLKPTMGWVADRFGMKRSLTIAIAVRSLVGLLLVFARSPWELFAIRGLHGVSIALRDPPANALIAEMGGKRAVASRFAWYQTAKTVAGNAGRALAGFVLAMTASSFSWVFAVAFALSVLPIVVVVRHVRDTVPVNLRVCSTPILERAQEGSTSMPSAGRAPDRTRRSPVLPYVAVGFLISATAYMMSNLLPILATEYAGLTEAEAGGIFLVGAVLALSGPVWGWLSDHVSRNLVLSVRSLANTLSSVLYWVAPTFAGLTAGRAFDEVGKAAFRPAWGAIMAEVAGVDRSRRARVMSRLTAADDAGEVVGPIVAGLLWSAWGVPVLLAARIVLALVTEVFTTLFTRSLRDQARPSRPPPAEPVGAGSTAPDGSNRSPRPSPAPFGGNGDRPPASAGTTGGPSRRRS
jgi:MFS family permease